MYHAYDDIPIHQFDVVFIREDDDNYILQRDNNGRWPTDFKNKQYYARGKDGTHRLKFSCLNISVDDYEIPTKNIQVATKKKNLITPARYQYTRTRKRKFKVPTSIQKTSSQQSSPLSSSSPSPSPSPSPSTLASTSTSTST